MPLSPDADEQYRMLLRKAGSLLAKRSYSRGQLRDRISRYAGELPLEPVLVRLEQLNLLNDEDYAYNFAFCRIRQQGWGPARVRRLLLQRQVDPATVASVLDRIAGEVDNESVLLEYVEKHCAKKGLPTDHKGARKLVLHLRRRGFDFNAITRALKRILPATVWQCFETGE